jgi:hypothetical protein
MPTGGKEEGEIPTEGTLLAATLRGAVEELLTLIAAGADLEQKDEVRSGTSTEV